MIWYGESETNYCLPFFYKNKDGCSVFQKKRMVALKVSMLRLLQDLRAYKFVPYTDMINLDQEN